MERVTLFADVLLPLPVRGTFTYRVPHILNDLVVPGQRVAVQFGKKRIYAGLIKKIHKKVPHHTPKYILHLLDEHPIVNEKQFLFWDWIASYYMSTLGEVMNVALPTVFKLASESKVMLSPDFKPDQAILQESEYRITEALLDRKKLSVGEISRLLGFNHSLPFLKNMIDKKLLIMEEELSDGFKPKKEKFVSLSSEYHSDEKLKELLDQLGKRAHKQLEIVMSLITLTRFSDQEHQEVGKSVLLKKSGAGQGAYKSLIDKGIIEENIRVVSRLNIEPEAGEKLKVQLTDYQTKAFLRVKELFKDQDVTLLHGVTSSGKTELYIKLIQETIQSGKQVLYLLPEIALTTQIITRLKKYFGNQVGIYHSRYGKHERAEVWKNIAGFEESSDDQSYKIILGPRSAIFLPFESLGLIIVDEEHDYSFKQFDPAPRYHARDAAIYLATLHKAKVLLGSATPAIESYYNAKSKKYGLVELNKRFGDIKMPAIEVIDMKDEQRRRLLKSHFSSVLLSEIKKSILEQKQVILFQNRRGFSVRLECDQCNYIPHCKYCDVTLTYHKHNDLIRCHYCGYSTSIPSNCPECGSTNLKMKGFGTEKVEEELSTILPEVRIDRMDLDSTRSKNAYHRILNDFANRKTDILTGTQMVTKGLDFDHVRLVGVLSADNLLSFPDFRAHERGYQLLSQVSGRSGRKYEQGKVIIQAWNPDHPIIRFVVDHDYHSMYESQVFDRNRFRYPPFFRLINIRLKNKKPDLLNEASFALAKDLRTSFGDRVIGPEYPLVSRIKSFYIKQIIIKNQRGENLSLVKQKIYEASDNMRKISRFRSVLIQFDVDPI